MTRCSMTISATSAAVLALGAMSANSTEVGVVIGVAPPLPKVEAIPVIPVTGSVWRPGYWLWQQGRYVWVPGAYTVPPQPHAVWVSGHWTPAAGGWVWVAGYWR